MQPMSKKTSLNANQPPAQVAIAACTFEIGASGDGSMQLFPAGTFDAPRGAMRGKGPWRLDVDSAQRLIGVVSQRQNDIVVDYEHQSLLTAQNGQPVIAAAWINPQSLEWREPPAACPGLFAIGPKFTAVASAHIAADEIRYVSPVFSYDAKTGEVLDILNVALTNNPAIDGMQAVTVAATSLFASVSTNPQESTMDELLERLRYLLNLPLTSTPEEIAAELDKLKAMIAQSDTAATSLLDVLSGKNAEIAALSVQAGAEVDLTKFAPIEVVDELRTQLAALSVGTVEDKVGQLIEAGKKDGRIIGAKAEAWLTDMGKKDIAALSAYLDAAQPIAALTGMQTGGQINIDHDEHSGLTADELAVCSALNVDVNEFKKTKAA